MLNKSVNIISFDVPFPANYGGIIDVYYKLEWLKKKGIKIHLHCFSYGRAPAKELEALCEKVFYYPRKTGLFSNLSLLPYTVKSRQSAELEKNLLSNDFPILFEVLHTCYLLNDPRFENRKKIYRHSNIEHDYYLHLASSEKNWIKKIYLKIEAKKLKKFERVVSNADYILAVNKEDADYFKNKYQRPKTIYLPSFHQNNEVQISEVSSDYILYHGNLSISENYEAADWLIKNVFSRIRNKVIIAGLNPPDFLRNIISEHDHIILEENPPAERMDSLIANAQINCLYTAQDTGLKLKLLNVLFRGRFIICNDKMLSGTGIAANGTIITCDTGEEYVSAINELMEKKFTASLSEERKNLVERFSNEKNIATLIDIL